ncbi:PREDICTED: selenoprotein BthD [Rhagoletis zephyria]|uniref:selenoprotein BthD n=1 Tax=Rhagoletis zephyria TaxID=28612 RepID=UPI000811A251|nr:PREDICTED: selenoprotein BthD [Rhagoletis zephyria]
MAPKGKKPKKIREIDWAADANFDKNRCMIYIEHTHECPIFQTKAEEFAAYVRVQVPNRIIQLVRNQNGKVSPREGAFEIGFSQNARTSVHKLWSGIDMGPPRRDKFPPSYEPLMQEIRNILKKFYPEAPEKDLLEDMDDDGGEVHED